MIPVFAALGLIIGGVAVVTYWEEIKEWLCSFVKKLKSIFLTIKEGIIHAAGVFVQKVKDIYAAIKHKLYYKEQGQWIEETTTRKIPESELPDFVKRKISHQEVDMTDEFEEELKLEIS